MTEKVEDGKGSEATGEEERDFYAVLGVARDCDATALKRAYHRLALAQHPDRVGPKGDAEAAHRRFTLLSQAYHVLSDERSRKLYDEGTLPLEDDDEALARMDEEQQREWCRQLFEKNRHGVDAMDVAAELARSRKSAELHPQDAMDLRKAYDQWEGQLNRIMAYVNCTKAQAVAWLSNQIQEGNLRLYAAFEKHYKKGKSQPEKPAAKKQKRQSSKRKRATE